MENPYQLDIKILKNLKREINIYKSTTLNPPKKAKHSAKRKINEVSDLIYIKNRYSY